MYNGGDEQNRDDPNPRAPQHIVIDLYFFLFWKCIDCLFELFLDGPVEVLAEVAFIW